MAEAITVITKPADFHFENLVVGELLMGYHEKITSIFVFCSGGLAIETAAGEPGNSFNC